MGFVVSGNREGEDMSEQKKSCKASEELDQAFVQIARGLGYQVMKTAEDASAKILSSTDQFLGKRAQDAVKKFHALYFGTAKVEETKKAVNDDVDNLIDQIRGEMSSGVSDAELGSSVKESEQTREWRLGLSGIQKELETIIQIDKGIREKLVPVLWSLQFEDMIRQRLNHVLDGWELVMKDLENQEYLEPEKIGEQIAALLTSTAERESYYRLVLKREPPAGAGEDSAMLFDVK
jgi:hypothetical protein